MVSTRGLRYKFCEGERVLCYEPDPTKAKVLYDSKVLEVIESKDKRGRRTVEYLIHFQGWNSSWDRCVSEDFVLKDTEENRQLQRDLADKSQLQLGAYLYRKERKKVPVPAKRPRQGFSDDNSSTSTQPDESIECPVVQLGSSEPETAVDTDSSLGSDKSQASVPLLPLQPGRAHIVLPPSLRDRLTFDYHLVVKRGRLSALPASPSAADILESFVKWFARSGAWRPVKPARPDAPHKPDWIDVCCRLNLVREVADGIRVYFDFILKGHLLYKQEVEQYHEVCGRFMETEETIDRPESNGTSPKDDNVQSAEEDIKSPKIPEYAHLPPDPTETRSEDSASPPENAPPLARRLRSHKSCVSAASEGEEPAPSASSAPDPAPSTVSGGSGSSAGSRGWPPPPPPATTRSPLSAMLDKIAKWQIIPREGTEHLPCRVYGAIHLARLFVKLPDFLNATQMPDQKLKLVLKQIDLFIQFLDEHNEWFGEMYYMSAAAAAAAPATTCH